MAPAAPRGSNRKRCTNEHLKCRFAEGGRICVMLNAADIPKSDVKLDTLISQRLDFASPKQIRELQNSEGIVLLVDDVDKCPVEVRQKMFACEPRSVRIVATARSLFPEPAFKTYHVTGVDWLNIVHFLRTIDNKLAAGKPFVDRARVFIDRAFQASGLPKTPFTIAVMLEECQHNVGKFSTPTMGRLIGRFIELQLGSHSDTSCIVDFETKREFLTRLAGHTQTSFPIAQFARMIGKFIEAKGHPHSIADLSGDLLSSGIFHKVGDTVEWAHPVIREFFWVKNLISQNRLRPIEKRLAATLDPTLAALAGSQLEDASELIEGLLQHVAKINLPTFAQVIESPEFTIPLSKLITEKDEETLLADLESEKLFTQASPPVGQSTTVPVSATQSTAPSPEVPPEYRHALKKRLETIVTRVACQRQLSFTVSDN